MILFLTRNDRSTIRRYLCIAEYLDHIQQKYCFVEVENGVKTRIIEEMDHLDLDLDFFSVSHNQLKKPGSLWQKIKRKFKKGNKKEKKPIKIQTQPYFYPKENILSYNNKPNFTELIEYTGFNTDYVIGKEIDYHLDYFSANCEEAKYLFELCPAKAVVYDIEFIPSILAILSESKKRSIPIISLQHADGYSPQYSTLPILADYYIAYSRNNVDSLINMGVNNEHIFLTGLPEPHIPHDSKGKRLNQRNILNISDKKIVILIALRPCHGDVFYYFRLKNLALLHAVKEVFEDNNDYVILLRLHPRDNRDSDPDFEAVFEFSKMDIRFTGTRMPIEELMIASDFFITFQSASIVQAVTCGIPLCVIDDDDKNDGSIWPDWSKYHIYSSIQLESSKSLLQDIKEGRWPENANFREDERQKFINEFVPKRDIKNAERIANIIRSHEI